MYVLFDKNLIIRAISDKEILAEGLQVKRVARMSHEMIGKRMPSDLLKASDFAKKELSQLRVAVVCNWNDQCGISTYSGFLVKEMRPLVADLKVFSEKVADRTFNDEPFVERCWKRGESLLELGKKINDWSPDLVLIQHEYGIFPNAFYWMQLMQRIEHIPYAVTLHSVYRHLDKTVYNESIKNVVVHSEAAKKTLADLGNTARAFVIPHGCVQLEKTDELWNIFLNPYTVLQFGFGFAYKGVDRALKAIAHLKNTDPKFRNIFYIYLCSTNSHNNASHYNYYQELLSLATELGIEDNVAIIRKYQTEEMLNLYLRLAKLAIFPYVIDESNRVNSASGAIRIAMANKKPVIASESGHFDDLDGIVPRPKDHVSLSQEIDKVFSNAEYRDQIIAGCQQFIAENSWPNAARRYLELYNRLVQI